MKKILSIMALLLAFSASSFADDTWTVAGGNAAALNGTSTWDPTVTDNDMTLTGGYYSLTIPNCTLAATTGENKYEFKVCQNHAWTYSYGYQGGDGNSSFNVSDAGTYTVIYTYNPLNNYAEGAAISSMTLVSEGSLTTSAWDTADAAYDMTQSTEDPNVFTLVINGFSATKGQAISYKVTANHAWGVWEIPASGNAVITFPSTAKYNITFTANIAKRTIEYELEAVKQDYTVTFVNGAKWENVYAHAWSTLDEVDVPVAAYPGTKLSKTGTTTINEVEYDVYTYTLNAVSAPEKILFNNGGTGDGNQTADQTFTAGEQYSYGVPEVYYIHGDFTGGGWANGLKMTLNADGLYEYVLDPYSGTAEQTFQYRVATNADDSGYVGGGNETYKFNVTSDYQMTFLYNATDAEINGVAAKSFTCKGARYIGVGSTGYATFSSTEGHDFSGLSIKAYKASVSGSKVELTQVDKVAANNGVVLIGAADTKVPVPYTGESDNFDDNALKATGATTATMGANDYVLAAVSGAVGFYKATSGTTLAAGKAYLTVPAGTAPEFLGFADDMTTGIEAVQSAQGLNEVYNLAGQRVAQPTKGLYIVNGKKVVLK